VECLPCLPDGNVFSPMNGSTIGAPSASTFSSNADWVTIPRTRAWRQSFHSGLEPLDSRLSGFMFSGPPLVGDFFQDFTSSGRAPLFSRSASPRGEGFRAGPLPRALECDISPDTLPAGLLSAFLPHVRRMSGLVQCKHICLNQRPRGACFT